MKEPERRAPSTSRSRMDTSTGAGHIYIADSQHQCACLVLGVIVMTPPLLLLEGKMARGGAEAAQLAAAPNEVFTSVLRKGSGPCSTQVEAFA